MLLNQARELSVVVQGLVETRGGNLLFLSVISVLFLANGGWTKPDGWGQHLTLGHTVLLLCRSTELEAKVGPEGG